MCKIKEFSDTYYPKGTRVVIDAISKDLKLKAGARGTVRYTTPNNTLICEGENGEKIGIYINKDKFSVVENDSYEDLYRQVNTENGEILEIFTEKEYSTYIKTKRGYIDVRILTSKNYGLSYISAEKLVEMFCNSFQSVKVVGKLKPWVLDKLEDTLIGTCFLLLEDMYEKEEVIES